MKKETLTTIRQEAAQCQACDLWKLGTGTVFGEGSPHAQVMLIGEQPGDQEDLQGRPFVGPAGKLLDRVLKEAGIDRAATYLTNAVKHFKWEPRGKRRIHKKPNSLEVHACKPWLEAEIAILQPQIIVCMGATAAQSLLGRTFRVTTQRGVPVKSDLAPHVLATVHPSSLLRAPDEETRRREMRRFLADFKVVAKLMQRLPAVQKTA